MYPDYDVVIIGAGVVGACCARVLSHYDLRVLFVDKGADVCGGASKANSGIVHSATSTRPGSWKARMCRRGNELMDAWCDELHVPFRRCGSLTVALNPRHIHVLNGLAARGEANGEVGLEVVSGQRLWDLEPRLSREAVAALYAPSGGIVNPMLLTIAAAEHAVTNGVDLALETEVTGFVVEAGRITGVETSRGTIGCRWAINAAGTHADEIMALAGIDDRPRITPRRGDYYVLDRPAPGEPGPIVSHVLFPIPTPTSKGILVAPTAEDNVLLGPTSLRTDERDHPAVTSEGLSAVEEGVHRLVPEVDLSRCIAVYAGVRASGSRDFVVRLETKPLGLLNLAAIESPGLTSAPALAETAVGMLRKAGLELAERAEYQPRRRPPVRVTEMATEERAALVRANPAYGRIVCRCEQVSEGEVVDAIHAPVPATTLDALKKRLRVGAGRCQGGFDLPLLTDILARELGRSPLDVSKSGPGGEVLTGVAPAREGRL